jgi:hypothetical protein
VIAGEEEEERLRSAAGDDEARQSFVPPEASTKMMGLLD